MTTHVSRALPNLTVHRSRAAPLRGAAGPASAPGSALWRPARRTPGHTAQGHADRDRSPVTQTGAAHSRLPRPAIVQLAVTVSMAALRAIARDRHSPTIDTVPTRKESAPTRKPGK